MTDIVPASFTQKIISFYVFEHYLVLILEKDFKQELKIINLSTNLETTIQP